MTVHYRNALVAIALLGLARPASADVICDWNTKALDFIVSHRMLPPPAERIVAMTQLAMFDAVNSIDRKYRPYLVQLAATPTASADSNRKRVPPDRSIIRISSRSSTSEATTARPIW